MSNLPAVMPLSDADYELIESAVMETVRGRWFLAEYARRNRHADTTMLLAAIDRLQAAIDGQRAIEPFERIRFELREMAQSIARTKAEMARLRPDAEVDGGPAAPSQSAEWIIQANESTTSKILNAAEQIEDIVWTLREQGLEAELCDVLDAKATEIYSGCSEHDILAQHSAKLIETLHFIEERLAGLREVCEPDLSESQSPENSLQSAPCADLANPRPTGDELPRAWASHASGGGSGIEAQDHGFVRPGTPGDLPDDATTPAEFSESSRVLPMEEKSAPEAPAVADSPARFQGFSSEVLRRIGEALSPEEKIALFS